MDNSSLIANSVDCGRPEAKSRQVTEEKAELETNEKKWAKQVQDHQAEIARDEQAQGQTAEELNEKVTPGQGLPASLHAWCR